MRPSIAEDVYYTLLGALEESFCVPGIENAFTPGSECHENHAAMLAAYERLRAKPGGVPWDADAEIMINTLLDNQKILCQKMYEYGQKNPGG